MKLFIIAIGLISVSTIVSAKEFTSDFDRFQGKWIAEEVQNDKKFKLEATFAKAKIDFKSSSGEWYKGTFELDEKAKKIYVTVKDGPVPEFKGKVSNGIYRFENDQMTIVASAPGSDHEPEGFDDPKCRSVTLTRK